MFVADEGDGKLTTDSTKVTTFAGLQEWKLSNGTWSDVATFQNGLLTQAAYTPTGLTWKVQQDGLRNITGQKNADGSFTIFGTTSTVSDTAGHDLGADPNEVVSITVNANSTAANTSFSVLQTATAGVRLGGVALAPNSTTIAAVPEPESYALMLAGMGLFGFVFRRNEKPAA